MANMFPLTDTRLKPNWAEVAKAQFDMEEELEYQARIVIARDYFEGQFPEDLHDELEQALVGTDLGDEFTAPNLSRVIVTTLRDRLEVTSLQFSDEEQAKIVNEWWKEIAGIQHELHMNVIRDGEAFVIADFEEDQEAEGGGKIRYYVHERYTDPAVDGDGQGCRAHYEGKQLLFVSKRWTETVYDRDGNRETRNRMTLYFEDRIEKYVAVGAFWEEYKDEMDSSWPITWINQGKPIGIAAVHFRSPEMRPKAKDAWGMQIASDHTVANLLSAMSMHGFPILTSNVYPTTDGEPPEDDGSNVWKIGPRTILGTADPDTKIGRIDSGDLGQLTTVQNMWTLWTAVSTNTPSLAAMMILGRNISGETLKQFDLAQISEANRLQEVLGNTYQKLGEVSRSIFNAFGTSQLDETVEIRPSWKQAEVRDREQTMKEVKAKLETGVPLNQVLLEWNYTPSQIVAIKRYWSQEQALQILKQRQDPAASAAVFAILNAWSTNDDGLEEEAWRLVEAAMQQGGMTTTNDPQNTTQEESTGATAQTETDTGSSGTATAGENSGNASGS